jgi:hypothetical protein
LDHFGVAASDRGEKAFGALVSIISIVFIVSIVFP